MTEEQLEKLRAFYTKMREEGDSDMRTVLWALDNLDDLEDED